MFKASNKGASKHLMIGEIKASRRPMPLICVKQQLPADTVTSSPSTLAAQTFLVIDFCLLFSKFGLSGYESKLGAGVQLRQRT